jgi:hypothetical protein
MKDFILLFDFLSPIPNLKINKNDRLKNNISSLASLLAIAMIISVSGYLCLQMFIRADSNIIYNSLPNKDQIQNISQFPYMIGVFSNLGKPISDDEKIYYIQSEIWNMYHDNTNGTIKQVAKRTLIQQEKCDINKHFGEYRKIFENIPYLSSYYCPIPGVNNLTLYSQFSTESIFIGHYISRCVNNSQPNRTCKDSATIHSTLANTYVIHKFLEFSIEHKNFSDPGSLTLRNDALPVSTTIFSRYWYYYKNIIYNTDLGYIFEDMVTNNYFEVSRAVQTVNLNRQGPVPGSFALISLTMDYKLDFYQRSYLKCQGLIAYIGGMIKGILIILQLLLFYLNKQLYYYEIVSSLFKINNLNETTNKISTTQKNFNQSSIFVNSIIRIRKEEDIPINNFHLVSKKSLNKKLKHEFKINFYQIFFPKFCLFKNINKKIRNQYEILIDYINNKLCVKELINSLNEIEKLKYHLLPKEDLVNFNAKNNPLPNDKNMKTIWSHEYLQPTPEILIIQN